MAKGKKTGGRDWGPDNPAPPGKGAPKLSPEVQGVRRMNLDEFLRICDKYLEMPLPELKKIIDSTKNKSSTLPVKELMLATIVWNGIGKGDPRQYEFILERMIGKAPMKVIGELSGPKGAPIPISSQRLDYSKLTTEELQTLERIIQKAIVPA